MGKKSQKRKKQRKAKVDLKLYEEVVCVPDNGFNYHVPVVVLATDRNEALTKINNRKWWKKTGLRPLEEFK